MKTNSPIHYALKHPATEGHFNDRPILPGVVILNDVLSEIRIQNQWHDWNFDCSTYKVISAKFMAPIVPGDQIEVGLTKVNTRINFECKRLPELTVAAKGTFEFAISAISAIDAFE
jgi:3-hydroxyacyl-[acyl-carrier-protein] dehydratase